MLAAQAQAGPRFPYDDARVTARSRPAHAGAGEREGGGGQGPVHPSAGSRGVQGPCCRCGCSPGVATTADRCTACGCAAAEDASSLMHYVT
eukprot:scaffold693_cov399-Prasinococcus_capsulatus_cf.AAC.12